MTEPMIARGSTILVTGTSSFIASHIADQLLIEGLNVRGSVRSKAKGEALQNHFDEIYGTGRFEYVLVEDITVDDAFDKAVKGMSISCRRCGMREILSSNRSGWDMPYSDRGDIDEGHWERDSEDRSRSY
jgi:NADP-dependent 3-hydroxy acid dehydrogenase YdfG